MDQIAANRELADGLLLKVSEATSGITGHDFILELTRKIPSILGMWHCFVAECANEEKTRLRTIAFSEGENVLDNIEYSICESACREMMGCQPYFLNKGAHLIYKAAKGIEAYVGAPILNPTKSMKMLKGNNQPSIEIHQLCRTTFASEVDNFLHSNANNERHF